MPSPLYSEYRKWPKNVHAKGDGIVVASDLTQEWLLPWWWSHYSKSNQHPVTWIDFGMSEKMLDWCRERGTLVRLRVADIFVVPQEEIAPSHAAHWEEGFGVAFWSCRNAWFKKPMACLLSPYERTIWIDSDCEVRGSLSPVFSYCNHPSGLSLRREGFNSSCGKPVYNSGVISYRWGLPLMEKWADLCIENNHEFMGDEDVLSQILVDQKIQIQELPDIYNRSRRDSEENALVIHWHGSNGKKIIESRLIRQRLESLSP